MHFRRNILLYIFVPLLVLLVGASYFRFMVLHDYMVAYEGECDPDTNSCFIGCNDDECTEEYYYSKMKKYAPDLLVQCGEDITDCEVASICLQAGDRKCSITYCDPQTDVGECESLSSLDANQEDARPGDFIQSAQETENI